MIFADRVPKTFDIPDALNPEPETYAQWFMDSMSTFALPLVINRSLAQQIPRYKPHFMHL